MKLAIRPSFFLLFIIIVFSFPAFADLSGTLKYSFENNYTDLDNTAQFFSQEYLTSFRGAVFEDRIGNYQLGLQYQRGITELKNLTFSNTLNFRDSLKVTSSYLTRDYGSLLTINDHINDNRYSISAVYFSPNLPSLTAGYETGTSKSATFEGINKYDKKGEIGMNYSFLNNNLSARFSRSVLYDNTYLSTSNNVINRNDLFSLNGSSNLGERIQLNGSFFNQILFNQLGNTSIYNQKQQKIIASGSIKISPYLSVNPQYIGSDDLTDFAVPVSRPNYQNSKRTEVEFNFHPVNQMEFIIDGGGGQVEYGDAAVTGKKQDLIARKIGMNLNLIEDFLINTSLRDEIYSSVDSNGKVINLSSYISIPLRKGLKLTFRKSFTDSSGTLYSTVTTGIGRQDLDDIMLIMYLPNDLYFEGDYSLSTLNTFKYRNVSAGIKFSPRAGVFELKHEFNYGDEGAQIVNTDTDSLKANFSFGRFEVSEQIALINSRTFAGSSVLTIPGFRNNSEIKYIIGETIFDLIVNSERRDSNASVYTRTYLSIIRNF